jgi:serine protease SohB
MFGENTDEGRQKFKQEIEQTHQLFKDYVAEKRPQVNIDDIATGEHWHAQDAKSKALVDEINTSDDYLLRLSHDCHIYHLSYKVPKSALERFKQPIQKLWGHINDYLYAKRL